MSVFLWKSRTSYVAVPKVACTSIKIMLFEVENGRPFKPFTANGQHYHIHRLYPSLKFASLPRKAIEDHARFALVRDPVQRFLSAYSNRVVKMREVSRAVAGPDLLARDLPPDPDLATFIDRVEDYCAVVPSIAHHLAPMVEFLGAETGYYQGIFAIDRMEGFLAALSARIGRPLAAPHLQVGGPKIDPASLSAPQLAAVKRRYAEDYDLYGAWL